MERLVFSIPRPKKRDGDQIVDNILYCGKCLEPREQIVDGKIVPKNCRCDRERLAILRQQEKEAEIRDMKMRNLMGAEDLHKVFLPGEQTKAIQSCKAYVKQFKDKTNRYGLLLYGPPGTGKTYTACCIANALMDQSIPVRMTNFTRLSEELLERDINDASKYSGWIASFPLLILDDFGTERQTEYMQELVTNTINRRYNDGKPMIITTNLPLSRFKEPQSLYEERLFDRILQTCFPIHFKGESRRRDRIKEDYFQRLRELTGDDSNESAEI